MQLTIKGLKGDQEYIDINEDASVIDLKAVIMSKLGHPVPCQKLLHKGKILEDNKNLLEYQIKSGDTIVIMIIKSQEPSTNEKAIQELLSMGFERPDIEAALKLTENNTEEAIRYLMSAPGQEEDEDDDEDNENLLMGSTGTFGFLLNSEEFLGIREILRRNPNQFEPMMQQLESSNPELHELIRNNTEEFLNLVGLRLAPRPEIELTSQEETDVKELCELGFPPEDVIEAYIACDKKKDLAASYLFENYQQNFD
jgi:uncharacterized ubiquitin-like protein YukD